jgi:hypothetical protein
MLSVMIQAQSFTGSYQMTGVYVKYTNVARMTESADDSVANYLIEAHWPSTASSVFSAPLLGYAPGDTIVVIETPDILLSSFGLSAVGIDLSVALNQEDGQMLIPGVEGGTSTYPTTDTESCSTFFTIAPVTDNANIEYTTTSNSYDSDAGTFTWGFGISQSSVFDWYEAPSDWENPDVQNYGWLTGHFNSAMDGFDMMELNWHAIDGQGSNSGIDDAGYLNRHLGITRVPGDTVTVAFLNAALGTSFNVGSYPILGGSGQDLDGDGSADGVLDTDWGYYFDPTGDDGAMMSGDEPFQFTGYYFTYNDLAALSAIMTAAGDDADGDGVPDNVMALIVQYMTAGYDQATATMMAIDYVGQAAFVGLATAFGVDATTAAAGAAAVGAYAQATYAALVAAGDPNALENMAQATAYYAVGVLASLGVDVDDSDHDFNGVNGRLVFQIGNSCVPDFQARDVYAIFSRIEVSGIDTENILPAKFAVHENYPNPFNPTTNISFDLVEHSPTEVTVWNMLGQKVATLYSGELPAGRHTLTFEARSENGNTLPSGVYIYKVAAGNKVDTKKMMLLK